MCDYDYCLYATVIAKSAPEVRSAQKKFTRLKNC